MTEILHAIALVVCVLDHQMHPVAVPDHAVENKHDWIGSVLRREMDPLRRAISRRKITEPRCSDHW